MDTPSAEAYSVQSLYIGVFGRPADPEGMDYYLNNTDIAEDLSSPVGLAGTAEFQFLYGDMPDLEVINQVYQNLYNRDADPEGLDMYTSMLQEPGTDIVDVVAKIVEGTSGYDMPMLAAKIEIADLWTSQIDTEVETASYVGDYAAEFASEYMSEITGWNRPNAELVQANINKLVEPAPGEASGGEDAGGISHRPVSRAGEFRKQAGKNGPTIGQRLVNPPPTL